MPGSPRGVPTSLPVCAAAFRNGAALDKLRFYKIYYEKHLSLLATVHRCMGGEHLPTLRHSARAWSDVYTLTAR